MSVRKLRKPLLISRPFLGAIDGLTIGLIWSLWTDFLWLAKVIVIFVESLSYAISLKHHEMRKHDNAMLGHPDMFWFDTRGVTHGDTWSSGTRSCQWGDSAGTPRHMLPWNYKSKHQFGTFLITTKKLKCVTPHVSPWVTPIVSNQNMSGWPSIAVVPGVARPLGRSTRTGITWQY